MVRCGHNYREPPTVPGRQTDRQDASGCQRLVPLGPTPAGIRNVTQGNCVDSRGASYRCAESSIRFDSVSN